MRQVCRRTISTLAARAARAAAAFTRTPPSEHACRAMVLAAAGDIEAARRELAREGERPRDGGR
jgi:hypothetical protein